MKRAAASSNLARASTKSVSSFSIVLTPKLPGRNKSLRQPPADHLRGHPVSLPPKLAILYQKNLPLPFLTLHNYLHVNILLITSTHAKIYVDTFPLTSTYHRQIYSYTTQKFFTHTFTEFTLSSCHCYESLCYNAFPILTQKFM